MVECGKAKTDPMAPVRPQVATSLPTSVFVGVRKSTERTQSENLGSSLGSALP